MFNYAYDPDDDDLEELRLDAIAERQHLNRLARHPDCRDPDHPGCQACQDNEDEDDHDDE